MLLFDILTPSYSKVEQFIFSQSIVKHFYQ